MKKEGNKYIKEIRKLEGMYNDIANDPKREAEKNVLLKQLETISKKMKKC